MFWLQTYSLEPLLLWVRELLGEPLLEVFLLRVRASMPVYICAPSSLVVLFWPAKVWRGLHRLVRLILQTVVDGHYQSNDSRWHDDLGTTSAWSPYHSIWAKYE